ncbi:hypothetical protein PGT21_018945 [Puccinia graminis f. sp. tritici]|uniref:Uncharacterized protein n=1 Tax=Puccinia graminis f. sp. tritici TaxID=56615 RepID=A0A5B0LN10_PUCGR|nr:hypothetical protein PGT21_018945 [Puccinia graminis f. sp. tritici]
MGASFGASASAPSTAPITAGAAGDPAVALAAHALERAGTRLGVLLPSSPSHALRLRPPKLALPSRPTLLPSLRLLSGSRRPSRPLPRVPRKRLLNRNLKLLLPLAI